MTLSITNIFIGRESIFLLVSMDSYNSVCAAFLPTKQISMTKKLNFLQCFHQYFHLSTSAVVYGTLLILGDPIAYWSIKELIHLNVLSISSMRAPHSHYHIEGVCIKEQVLANKDASLSLLFSCGGCECCSCQAGCSCLDALQSSLLFTVYL